MNANSDNNLNQGQVTGNVGQDESTRQNENPDWETTAKYHQSEKDKLYSENQNLKKYEKIGKFLESRPDIVQSITEQVQGGQQEQQQQQNAPVSLEKDEFDPWEAYNDPSSKSYQFRQQELQNNIDNAVGSAVSGIQEQVGMDRLGGELQKRGLNDEQIKSFYDFTQKNPSEYGIDGAIKMWDAVTNEQPVTEEGQSAKNNPNPYDMIRQNPTPPAQAGVLTGQQPERKSEIDSMWDSIIKAGSRSNVL
jgi:hypothetical protein